MKFSNKYSAVLMLSISCAPVLSNADTITVRQSYEPSRCDVDDDTCSLESFYVKTTSVKKDGLGHTYMSAGFSVSENESLADYAIVQYHQGCMYKDTPEGIKFLHRSYMGKKGVPFVHPELAIDSANDSDPIYQSSERGGQDDGFGYIFPRKEYYYIFEPNLPAGNERQDSYLNHLHNPQVKALHITDVPTPANVDNKIVSSLNFKTCLFKMRDVPQYLEDPTTLSIDNAIKCFDWKHNWKINENNKLVRQDEIDSACFEGENK